jgi:HK97 family phage major capsid protein
MNAFDHAAVIEGVERLREAQAAFSLLRPKEYRDYSVRRAIRCYAAENYSGPEFEISQDAARTMGTTNGLRSLIVPWWVFAEANFVLSTRADIVGSTTAGGYLVDTLNVDAADALRPMMVCGKLGATFIDGGAGNVTLPKQTGTATASWLSAETTQISETDQTFGQQAYNPHSVGAYTEWSRLTFLQAAPSSVEYVVRRDLLSLVARALDLAAIQGSGSAGQPQGLFGMTGVQTFSGTSLALPAYVNAISALGNALNETTGVAASLSVAGILKQRPEQSASTRLMWEGSLVAGSSLGMPARSTAALSGAPMVIGSWNYLNICTWGGGIEILVNPYATGNFQAGIVGMRAMLTADVSPTWPAAFNVATTVT